MCRSGLAMIYGRRPPPDCVRHVLNDRAQSMTMLQP
jgi:hypothetical protein